MFCKAYEFGRKLSNVITYRDDIDDAFIKLGEIGCERIVAKSLSALRSKLSEINRSRNAQGLALMTLAIPLSACGPSSSSDSSAGDEAASLSEVSGRAIDGYLIGSMVSLSSAPDVFVQTNSTPGQEGSFEGLFGSGSIIVTGGVDLATGKSFTGELRAPAPEVVTDADGNQTTSAIVVTPLTTIVEAVFTASAASAATGGGAAVSVEEATAQVAKGLGLSSSSALLTTDFVATGSAGMAKAAAQIASVISVVTAAAGEGVSSAVMANIASKVAKAGEVGGKANILTDATELASVFNEVRETQAELFEDTPEGLDLDAFVDTISATVASVNVKVAQATSLKEIVATQQVLQDDIVGAFTIDADSDVPFDFAVFEAAVSAVDDNFEAILVEAAAELEIYLAESDFAFDLEGELDESDTDLDAVAIDLDLIDSAISGVLDEALLTGFIFGDVDEALLDGVMDGTVTQSEIDAVLDELPEYVIFEPIVGEIPIDEPVIDEPVIDEPVIEIPVDEPVVEEEEEEEEEVAAAAAVSSATTYNLTTSDDIQTKINAASDGDIIVLAAGRYDQNFTINKDIDIRGSNYGISVHAEDDDTVAEVYFDIADSSRSGGANESWINGTVTVASDGVTLDGLRMHAYNGPLEFSGTDVDNFTIKNSYVTGFEGSKSFRYEDTDGTASSGWNISDNLIGGVAGGVGGSLYLTGVTSSTVDDNVFWRPGAAHMYLKDVTSVTVSNNFFVQGLHADGANQDGLLDDLVAQSEWGYMGFSGGSGYGDVGGYGYGFGYGYDGSVAISSMGYGYGSEGGYGPTGYSPSGYGLEGYGSGGGTDKVFYGRNYVAEVKGTTDDITFTGNTAKYNSGGIQFWDENSAANSFTDTVISDNTFTDFINADPDGFLSTVSSRHKAGLVGGVTFSVVDGSSSTDLDITGNTFTGALGEIRNDNDIDSLILVQGEVDDVNISTNTLSWSGAALSGSSNLTAATARSVTYDVYTQGIHLAGDVNGAGSLRIAVQNNTFDTATVARYISDGLLIDGSDQSSLSLGTLSSDVYIVDSGSADYNTYVVSNDFGSYKTASDQYEPVSGTNAYASLTPVTGATAGTDIIYSQSDVI